MSALLDNMNYTAAIILFLVGLYTVAATPNLIKKIMGINIMETAVFLFIVSIGYLDGGAAPVVDGSPNAGMVNPIPQALILTGIVVAVSITAVGLAICIMLYRRFGTLDAREIHRAADGREAA